jgi:phosphate-selective porin OprO/OprP
MAEEATPAPSESTVVSTVEAGESDADQPKRRLVKWNEYDGPITTFRIGYGFLLEAMTFAQDGTSKEQVSMEPGVGVRDFRLLFSGRFKTKRSVTWQAGVMYDGADDVWRIRMTGLMIGLPEILGHVFIGRTKEGYSMLKVMNGYTPWTMERYTASDAFVPILADGVKWLAYLPNPRVFWSLGLYDDLLGHNESFCTFEHQAVVRLGWQPVLSEKDHEVLHVALMARSGKPDNGDIRPRSKPEANLAPYFVDPGNFPADHSTTVGAEAYYRKGSWLYGTEYNLQSNSTPETDDPTFHGGDAFVAWMITGETRGYNSAQGYFRGISPDRHLFEGGPGAWEASLRMSYIDLDSGTLRGGLFWRISPSVNWFLSDNLALRMGYGYGVLDRYDMKGKTQFFQVRLQTLL